MDTWDFPNLRVILLLFLCKDKDAGFHGERGETKRVCASFLRRAVTFPAPVALQMCFCVRSSVYVSPSVRVCVCVCVLRSQGVTQ